VQAKRRFLFKIHFKKLRILVIKKPFLIHTFISASFSCVDLIREFIANSSSRQDRENGGSASVADAKPVDTHLLAS
jgi:hypothetical protein